MQAYQQTHWVMETEAKLKLEVQTIEGLKTMLRQGSNMPQSRCTCVQLMIGVEYTSSCVLQIWK